MADAQAGGNRRTDWRMREEHRLLASDGRPIASLAEYVAGGGLVGLQHVGHSTREAASETGVAEKVPLSRSGRKAHA